MTPKIIAKVKYKFTTFTDAFIEMNKTSHQSTSIEAESKKVRLVDRRNIIFSQNVLQSFRHTFRNSKID